MVSFSSLVVTLLATSVLVLAHHDEGVAIMDPEVHYAMARRSLADCAHELRDPVRLARRQEKHNTLVRRYLAERGLPENSYSSNLVRRAAEHKFTGTPECILGAQQTIGPYYVKGELLRNDMRENEPGIDVLLDVLMIDVNTCKPIPDLITEFWHCNSTGTYSGVKGQNTLGSTHNRGVVLTDSDGVAQMTTIFPGWYEGRASHIHILANTGGKVNPNNTYTGGRINHIGQIYFPENILTQVDKAPIYNTNKVRRTTNAGDPIYPNAKRTSKASLDANIELLGSKLTDGILAYITVGIDPKADKKRDESIAHWYSKAPGPAVTSRPAVKARPSGV